MELTQEKSEQQAEIIRMIAVPVALLDVEYCREIAKGMFDQVRMQLSLAPLNPRHPLIKNNLLGAKAAALNLLCDYVTKLKEVNELQKQLENQERWHGEIDQLFM